MNNKKNKRNTKRSRYQSNGLFGIKNFQKTFVVGEGENRRTVDASLWTVYEKSTGKNLAVGKFSQMMEIFSTMSAVDPAEVAAHQ